MSEHSVTALRLDVIAPDESEKIAVRLQELLLSRGVIVPNDRRDGLWQPSAWMPGPAARAGLVEPVDWLDAFLRTANNGVDIHTGRDVYHPVENDEPPRCPRCEAPAPSVYTDSYVEWLTDWIDNAHEPTFTCDQCGWAGLAGDWAGQFGVLVGGPAVRFLNWPTLSPALIGDLRLAVGGRTGIVASRW